MLIGLPSLVVVANSRMSSRGKEVLSYGSSESSPITCSGRRLRVRPMSLTGVCCESCEAAANDEGIFPLENQKCCTIGGYMCTRRKIQDRESNGRGAEISMLFFIFERL